MRKNIFLILFAIFIAFHANANPTIVPAYNINSYDQQIKKIYISVPPNMTITKKIIFFSNYFLGKPYLLGALGEGAQGKFDQNPLYRTDAFDCMTYVSTVLALSQAHDLVQFKEMIKKINYKNAKVSFVTRNHFTSIDWNKNNQRQHLIKDITNQFSVPVKTTNIIIDKRAWFAELPMSQIKLLKSVSNSRAQKLLSELHANGERFKPVISHINYLPLSELYSRKDHKIIVNEKVFAQIPTGAIIEIVASYPDMKQKIGTEVAVAHLGFAIKTNYGLMFRAASSHFNQVTDIPLEKYLGFYYKNAKDPAARGINIEEVIM